MNSNIARIAKPTTLMFVALPLLSALAGLILGPTVLHPFRYALTSNQIAEGDHIFSSLNATREDFVVHAPDRALLQGWKIRPARPNGDWILLLHGRSHNRLGNAPTR